MKKLFITTALAFMLVCTSHPLIFAQENTPSDEKTTAACKPFGVQTIEDLKNVTWQLYYEQANYMPGEEGPIRWRHVESYRTKSGLRMSIYDYFGQRVMLAWACNTGQNPKTGDTPDHVIAIYKDGEFYLANAQAPEFKLERDENDNPVSITLTLRDKNGGIVVERTVSRR
ncbi:MAG: hypothetical protein HY456_00855 [Parcubacteria group bacterium]|nr:hypothetical protein [Parcubacteria group bacterium]